MTVTWKGLCGGDKDKTEWVSLEEYNKLKADKDVLDKMLIGERLHCSLFADEWSKKEIARLQADLDYVRKMRTQETLDLQEMADWNNAMRARETRLIKAGEQLVHAINETSRKTFYPYELRCVHERAVTEWLEATIVK
jgi:hypothetical protein